jgi:hypothetical protein
MYGEISTEPRLISASFAPFLNFCCGQDFVDYLQKVRELVHCFYAAILHQNSIRHFFYILASIFVYKCDPLTVFKMPKKSPLKETSEAIHKIAESLRTPLKKKSPSKRENKENIPNGQRNEKSTPKTRKQKGMKTRDNTVLN